MLDTTIEAIKKQREVFYAKTSNERFVIGVETISFGRLMVENSIKQNQPAISELDLKIEVFKRYYKGVFSQYLSPLDGWSKITKLEFINFAV